MAGYTYSTFTTALANFLVVPIAQTEFVASLPSIIENAEQWCYRDVDFLQTIERDSSGALTAGKRVVTVVPGALSFVTPSRRFRGHIMADLLVIAKG